MFIMGDSKKKNCTRPCQKKSSFCVMLFKWKKCSSVWADKPPQQREHLWLFFFFFNFYCGSPLHNDLTQAASAETHMRRSVGCKSKAQVPRQNSGNSVVPEAKAILAQLNYPFLFLRLKVITIWGCLRCSYSGSGIKVVFVWKWRRWDYFKKYMSFIGWFCGSFAKQGFPSEGRFFSPHRASLLSTHIQSNSCVWKHMNGNGMSCNSHRLFVLSPGCRSVPDNVTTEGREHRTASSWIL